MSEWVCVARLDALEFEKPTAADLDDERIVLVLTGETVAALEDLCTHDGAEISSGCIVDGAIECPRHGARFCLKTGEVLAPPAYEGVHVFPVEIKDDAVWVRDDRWD